MKKYILLLSLLTLFSFKPVMGQNVNLEVQVITLSTDGYADCFLCTNPDPTWKISGTQNGTGGGTSGWSWHYAEMPSSTWDLVATGYSEDIVNVTNTTATQFQANLLDAFEKNCSNDVYTYTTGGLFSSCLSPNDDSRRTQNNIFTVSNFRTYPPCQWNTLTAPASGYYGDYSFQVRFYWSYAVGPTVVATAPYDRTNCTGTATTLSVSVANDAWGQNPGKFFQWQVNSSSTADPAGTCPTTGWTNVSGATSSSYTPPQTAGTLLYRCNVTSNCTADFTTNTTASQCFRVTYAPTSTPPAIQSEACGNSVLPGVAYSFASLTAPNAGAVINATGYQWSTTPSAGVTISTNNSIAASVTNITFPASGTYTVSLTYNDACPAADAVSTCTVTVSLPSCNAIYVATTGNDANAGGPDGPVASLHRAMALYAIDNTRTYIKIAGGAYTETSIINIPNNMVIEGQYVLSGLTWTKTSAAGGAVTLTMSGSEAPSVCHTVGFKSVSTTGWALIDLGITMGNSAAPASGGGCSNYGVYIQGTASNAYTIARCTIKSGNASTGSTPAPPAVGGGSAGGAGGAGSAACTAARNATCTTAAGTQGTVGTGSTVVTADFGAAPGSRGSVGCSTFSTSCGNSGNAPVTAAATGAAGTNSVTTGPIGTFSTYYLPGTQGGTGGNGGGGQGGGGGSGSTNQAYSNGFCATCAKTKPGVDGGTGGLGGAGGSGGTGGYGGGGSFGIFVSGTTTGSIADCNIVAGNGGPGGLGAAGSAGAAGIAGVTPTAVNNGTNCLGSCGNINGGAGGTGGQGGTGGTGGPGALGASNQVNIAGVASTPSVTIPNPTIVTAQYNAGLGSSSTNSEINITKANAGVNWTLPTGYAFENDQNSTTSSYTVSSNAAVVYSTVTGFANIVVTPGGSTNTLTDFINVTNTRTLPSLNITANPVCPGTNFTLSATTTGTVVGYDWVIFGSAGGNTVGNSTIATSTLAAPVFNATTLGLTAGSTYNVRMKVRDQCAGWCIPVYGVITISNNIAGGTIAANEEVCQVPGQPSQMTSTAGGSGGNGTTVYSWEYQDNCLGTWSVIASTNASTYTPPVGLPNTRCYRRNFSNTCGSIYSNIVTKTFVATPSLGTLVGPTAICSGSTFTYEVNGVQDVTGYSWSVTGATSFTPSGNTCVVNFGSTTVNISVTPQDVTALPTTCNGTAFTRTVTINPLPTTPGISQTAALCNGGTGSVTVSTISTSAAGSITYSLNSGTYQSGITFSPVAVGTVCTVTAKDANGCTSAASNSVTVTQPTAITTAALINTNVTCNGFNDGIVTVSPLPTGGTPSYTYSLNGGAYTGTTSYGSLAPNNYTVTVKDANGCTFNTNTVALTQPNVLAVAVTNDGPYYGTTQTVHLFTAVTGGTAAYTYNWTGPLSWSSTAANPAIPNAIVPMTGTYYVTVTDAHGCSATASSYVQVNSSLTYTWTGAISTDWNTNGNWSPFPLAGVAGCWADVIIPGGTLNQPVVSLAVNIGNLQVDAHAVLTLNADVSMCKDLKGGSTCCGAYGIVTGTSSLVLNGAVLEKINGLIKVNIIKLNNSAGAQSQPNTDLQVLTSLDLQSGNFDAGNGNIKFLSTSTTQVAIIDNFSTGYSGTMSGTIHAQRYYNTPTTANSYNQHFMGSPVNTPAFSQFGAAGTPGYLIAVAACDESKIAPGSPYSTVLALDETHGSSCTTNEWFAEVSGNAQNGTGYAVTRQGVGPGIITLTGVANLNSTYSINNLTNSNWSNTTLQGHAVVSGWHLVSDPYLATLNINSTNAGFDNQIQVWNTFGPYAGSYTQSMVGIDAVIAPFQGFIVHKTAPGGTANFTFHASDRVRTAQTFYRANDNQLKLVAENLSNNLLDQTIVAFNTAATDQFDPEYDANKPSGLLNRHTLYSVNNGQWMGRNILHDIAQTSTVPVGFEPGATANFNFSFNGVNSFDPTSYIYLEDKALHMMHDVRSGDYSFTADSTDAWDRFVLHFTPPATTSVTDASCTVQGVINVTQPGTANWNYTITDNNSHTTIANGTLDQNTPLSLNAPTGSYTLTLTDINNYIVTKVLQVNGPDAITAAFSAPAAVQEGQDVVLTSTTTNATNYQWNLGNGQTATGASVTYSYPTAGNYTVVLTVSNLSGCTSTTSQNITVDATATGLNNITEKGPGIWSNENIIYVDFRSLQKVDAVISIFNVLGQEISNEKFNTTTLYQKEISNIEAAYMIVSVKDNDKVTTKKVFINNLK